MNENLFKLYIPPCQRNPYYDDPRDVKPEDSQIISPVDCFNIYVKSLAFYEPIFGCCCPYECYIDK